MPEFYYYFLQQSQLPKSPTPEVEAKDQRTTPKDQAKMDRPCWTKFGEPKITVKVKKFITNPLLFSDTCSLIVHT